MEDQNISSIELLHNIKIVLVGTTHPGNIGASARAMKNMGLSNLILVEPKDSKSLAKAIEKLASNQRLINKFGKNGRNHVIKNFANELVIKKFREVYKSLLE